MIGTSMAMLSIFTFMPSEAQAAEDPWDNVFNGETCTGSGEYCWGGSTDEE